MAESKVTRDNYITIQGFMITDLKLKGNELLIYAIIYGFSQAENQKFQGTLQYLADWTNGTKSGVVKSLKNLIDKGFIVKEDKLINGVKFVDYYTTELHTIQQSCIPMQQSCTGGIQLSCTHNIDIDNIKDKKKESKERKKTSFDEIITDYAKGDAVLTDLLQEWLKVRKAKRAAMTDRAIKMNIEKLDNIAAQSNMTVPAYLQEVICRGWAAFYVIRNYGNAPAAKTVGANGIAINEAPSTLDGVF